MPVVLIIEDRADIRISLTMLLQDNGYQTIEADAPKAAKLMLNKTTVDLIILDMNFALDTTSGEEGLAFLQWLQQQDMHMPVIAMTAWSNIDLVVKAMQLGATDFIEKPWKNKRLLQIIQNQLQFSDLKKQNNKLKQQLSDNNPETYQWQSESMLQLLKQMQTVANTDVNVLLTGDNGTGKSALARKIHDWSARKNNVFVAVNMGAIAESLFESEMFGHKKGAFTDAKSNRIGRFALAENGTLFLDEIANIPLSQQAKLLRVIETGEYEVLGSSQTQKTNIRVISATNGDFEQLIQQEKFRQDLFYRLNTITFHVPALKHRQQDIIPLAEFFIAKFSHQYQKSASSLSDCTKQALFQYHWPGNIRELSHLIERAVLLTNSQTMQVDDLHLLTEQESKDMPMMTLEQAEIKLIKMALDQTDDNIPKAAKLLGLSKASMYRRIEKYAINKE